MEADPGTTDPAISAYRARIRERFVELQHERTDTAAKLDALTTAAPPTDDPTLLDELPLLADALQDAPPKLIAGLLEAFDIQAVYHKKDHQVTIRAVLTDDTPQAIVDLLTSLTPEHIAPSQIGQAAGQSATTTSPEPGTFCQSPERALLWAPPQRSHSD